LHRAEQQAAGSRVGRAGGANRIKAGQSSRRRRVEQGGSTRDGGIGHQGGRDGDGGHQEAGTT
jgi:hypothetical protein